MKVLDSIADAIGNTPLIRLSRMSFPAGHTVLAKCEFLNPGGSVKDRIAFHMVERAEAEGKLRPGSLIVEATGGNTGIGLALVAKIKGYKLTCVMSEKVGGEKVRVMQILGAKTVVVPGGKPDTDPEHFINVAKRIASEQHGWFVGQFDNEANAEAHYKTTGPEVWEQTDGKVDVFVAGMGTGGTLMGAGKFLKEKKPSLKVVLADPTGSSYSELHAGRPPYPSNHIIEGIGGDSPPGIVDFSRIDEAIKVPDDLSVATAHELLEKEALFVGGSAGCAVAAARKYLEQTTEKNLTVVVVLPSTGRLYTKTVFDEDWLKQKLS